ncbi:2-keto-4-pentenoate hydratase, partial [Nocardia nova]|nr:2-keto-4-pentenoate hydratase [Nocardia nova]
MPTSRLDDRTTAATTAAAQRLSTAARTATPCRPVRDLIG